MSARDGRLSMDDIGPLACKLSDAVDRVLGGPLSSEQEDRLIEAFEEVLERELKPDDHRNHN